MAPLSERERELLETMLNLSEAAQPLEIRAGDDTLTDSPWPSDVIRPTREG
jgi:hypothetical protein